MNLYLISQTTNNDYDTYDSAVVAAKTEDDAKKIHPRYGVITNLKDWQYSDSGWCYTPDQITVELIGRAKKGTKEGVIIASFNAG